MQDPTEILEHIFAEAKRVLQEMKETTDLKERKAQSKILRNLCQSAGVFFDLMSDTMMMDDFPDFLEDDED